MKWTRFLGLAILVLGGTLACTPSAQEDNEGSGKGKKEKAPVAAGARGSANAPDWGGEPSKYSGEPYYYLDFLPDGKQLLSASVYGLILWDLKTGKVIRVMEESRGGAFHFAVSPDGKWIFVGGGLLGVVWEIATGKLVNVFENPDPWFYVNSSAISSENRLAFVGGRKEGNFTTLTTVHGRLLLWDTIKGKIIHSLGGYRSSVYSVAISSDEKLGVSAGYDVEDFEKSVQKHTIKLWDLQKGKLIRNHEIPVVENEPPYLGKVSFSQGNKWIYFVGKTFRAWDVETGELIHLYEKLGKKDFPLAFSADKRFYITQEDERLSPQDQDDLRLTLWDMLAGKVVKVLDRGEDKRTIIKVQFSPNGKVAALSGSNELLQIWDLETGKLARDLILPEEYRTRQKSRNLRDFIKPAK
jgi:WD40 repeat protein